MAKGQPARAEPKRKAREVRPETDTQTQPRLTMEDLFRGAVTVGDRGQVVIPAEVRRVVGLSPGDKLLVFCHPNGPGVMMVKLHALHEATQFMQRTIEELEAQSEET